MREIPKDLQAFKLMLDDVLISPQQAIAANGYDFEEVIKQIAEAMELRELSLPQSEGE